jgi:hypothetical protein
MNQRRDLASAVRERERSRRRMRGVTVTVGAVSLATAGVVAYYLPRPAQVTETNGTTTPAPAGVQPSTANRHADDDGGGEGITAPSGTTNQAPAHAISGGSCPRTVSARDHGFRSAG